MPKLYLKVAPFFFFLMLTLNASAQKKTVSKVYLLNKNKINTFSEQVKSGDFFTSKKETLGLSDHDEMILQNDTQGKNNFSYQKFEQQHKGIPVYGSAYTLRIKDGIVQRSSGYYLPLIQLNTQAHISSKEAVSIAMDKMNAVSYCWESNAFANIPSYQEHPQGKLVIIDRAYPKSSEKYSLAFQVDLQSTEPLDKKRFFVDAHNGEILLDLPLLMNHAVPGKGKTKYYGEQSFTVDSIGENNYVLRDLTRGNGNTVFNSNGELFTDTDNYWDQVNENQDEVAIDAHYCTEKFYDLMLHRFDWEGIDNEGGSMHSIIHAGDFVNAFWDGNAASFGDGSCHHGPLTTLSVVGHEFMHGITQNSADLIYSSESGAINESMSDIFGKALEYFEDPDNFDWNIGSRFLETQYVTPFRSFEDPHLYGHPKFYKGTNWSSFDLVHTNSGVGNHWFYLLVNGGEGINEEGVSYSLTGIGMEKALEIVFNSLTNGLTANSDYYFYHEISKLVTEELFGLNSDEYENVEEAWKAIGVKENPPALDLSFGTYLTIVETCQAESYIPIEFTISNIGEVAYAPEMNGVVNLNIDNNNNPQVSTFQLTDEILPGETISYSQDELWFVEGEEVSIVFLDLSVANDNRIANNTSAIILNNALYEDNDLRLSSNTFSFPKMPICFGGTSEMRMTVYNNSCNTIEEGHPFELQIYDEDQTRIWSKTYTLPNDLTKGDYFTITESFDLKTFNTTAIQVVLDHDEEANPADNFFELAIPTIKPIESVYHQDFDRAVIPEIELNSLTAGRFMLPFLHENENYFASTSFTSGGQMNLCPDPEDFFESAKLTMEFCLDTKTLESPNLEFDLIQFRNEHEVEFPELENNTNLVQVTWVDGENDFKDIIIGQNEGELFHHVYELPSDQQGIVSISFFDNAGNSNFFNLENNDVTLLDNLAITGVLTNVEEFATKEFKVRPNPTNGLVTLSYDNLPEEIIVKNIHNVELIKAHPNPYQTEININHLPQGIYIFSLLYEDQLTSTLVTKIE